MTTLRFILPLAVALMNAGCAVPVPPAPEQAAAVPVRGKVTDVAAFERYIATLPTPQDFRARYPDVVLVLPGDFATKELRLDNSRYFAQLDEQGRIVGGKFQ